MFLFYFNNGERKREKIPFAQVLEIALILHCLLMCDLICGQFLEIFQTFAAGRVEETQVVLIWEVVEAKS